MPEELGTVQKKGMSKGCLIGLIIIGILAVFILVLGTLAYFYWEDIANWGLEKTTEMIAMEIKANLPAEYSEQDVDELFDKLTQALKNKENLLTSLSILYLLQMMVYAISVVCKYTKILRQFQMI